MKGLRQIVSVSPGETSGSEEIPALARFLFIFFMCQENKSDLKKMQHHVEEASVREVESISPSLHSTPFINIGKLKEDPLKHLRFCTACTLFAGLLCDCRQRRVIG
ncbi:unnamed protein product [Cuscuta europaea]|uniref:Uncharacterized protein n=1 Tax=Cuscuta europaea TaxID=41803 RepID=A0A9P0ZS76_CUSEU|nr:unnamed protein product [Cuscuta europaea]